MLALLLSTTLLAGCPNRKEIQAEVWLQTGVPSDLCVQLPELGEFGLYRKLNNEKYEFISYCKEESTKYIAINEKKFNDILDELLPEKR